MKLRSTLATLALVAALAATLVAAPNALAQGGGGRQGGGWGMRGGGMMQSSAFLLRRTDVQDDLKLTTEQKDKLAAMQEEMQTAMREKFAGGERPSREEMGKLFAEMGKKMDEGIATILTPDQVKRLDEIAVQMAGNAAALNPKYAKGLAITPDQKAKMDALQATMQKANAAIREKVQSGEIDREGMTALVKKNSDALNAEIGKILTGAQKDKLKAMSGAPFERKDEGAN